METWRNELYHHGILGQKWGKRNGPPYPLKEGQKSSVEKKADKQHFRLSDRQKRLVKIGAAAALTGLALYGTYKISSSGVLDKSLFYGKVGNWDGLFTDDGPHGKFGLRGVSQKARDLSQEYGFNLRNAPSTVYEDVKSSNPGYTPVGPLRYNCSHSTIAYVMRRMGLDVKALPMNQDEIDGGISPFEFKRYFKGCKYTEVSSATKESIIETVKSIANNENGACGVLHLPGHATAWEYIDGEVKLVDPQRGLDTLNDLLSKMPNDPRPLVARLDNIPVNPRYITKAVTNA